MIKGIEKKIKETNKKYELHMKQEASKVAEYPDDSMVKVQIWKLRPLIDSKKVLGELTEISRSIDSSRDEMLRQLQAQKLMLVHKGMTVWIELSIAHGNILVDVWHR